MSYDNYSEIKEYINLIKKCNNDYINATINKTKLYIKCEKYKKEYFEYLNFHINSTVKKELRFLYDPSIFNDYFI